MPKLNPKHSPTDKREAILAAALSLFAERGFHGTAVPLVADRAGVGAGTLYRYFTSKEALVNALYRKWKTALVTQVLSDFSPEKPARAAFHDFWERMARFARQNPEGFQFLELHHHAPYLDEESRTLELSTLQMIKAFIEEAQRRQQMKAVSAEVLIALVYGAFVGIVKGSTLGYLPLTDQVIQESENALWEAIRM